MMDAASPPAPVVRAWLPRLRSSALVAGLALVCAAVLPGCATTLDTQVTAFHDARTTWVGKRFAMVPADDQRDSLEFRAYADLVSRALQSKGLVASPEPGADVQVRLQYRSTEQRPLVYSSPVVGYGAIGPAWGFGAYPGAGGVYFGWYPYWGSYGVVASEYRQYRTWRRELRVQIQAPGSTVRLYEGVAFNEDGSDALPVIMPALVEAMFHDFPGPNGQVRRVLVELREPASVAPTAPPTRQPSAIQTPSK